MAKIRSGNLILSNGQKVYIGDGFIDSTTMSGIDNLYIDYFYGDGTYLTGIPRNIIDLLDTPVTYSGAAGQYLRVNQTETGIEFVTVSGSEGDYYTESEIDTISGTLHAQIQGIELIAVGIDKAGLTVVNSGSSSVSVVFDYPFSTADYILATALSNKVDEPIDIFSLITSDKSTDGFTVDLSGDVESGNYYLEWIAVSSGIGSGSAGAGADNSRAVIGGGQDTGSTYLNVLDYFTISSLSDATDFGDMTMARDRLGSTSNGANDRGIFMCGPPYNNSIDYITISTPGNGTDFGDMTMGTGNRGAYGACTSNNTNERGLYAGEGNTSNLTHYFTISTPGNTLEFGNLTTGIGFSAGATSNATNERGVYSGGYTTGIESNIISYVTISTTGNGTDFGDLLGYLYKHVGLSNGTNERGIFAGGTTDTTNPWNVIQYITISTTGNSSDFGDLSTTLSDTPAGTSNNTSDRGVICGGQTLAGTRVNTIEYITISTTGDSVDFGDLTISRRNTAGTSNA